MSIFFDANSLFTNEANKRTTKISQGYGFYPLTNCKTKKKRLHKLLDEK